MDPTTPSPAAAPAGASILDYTQEVAAPKTGGADPPAGAPAAPGAGGPAAPAPAAGSKARAMVRAVAIAAAVVLVIVVVGFFFIPGPLAHSLSKAGWVVYYRQGCGFCDQQKRILGGRFHKVVSCDPNGKQTGGYTTSPPLPCNSPQITGFPFWYNTRTMKGRVGLQDIQSLEKMAKWH